MESLFNLCCYYLSALDGVHLFFYNSGLDTLLLLETRSTIEGGWGCNKFVPVLRGNGTELSPTGDICVQPPGGMSWIRGKLADHVGACSPIPGRGCFGDFLGDGIVASPPFPIVEQLWTHR